jgi:hypothetical protein
MLDGGFVSIHRSLLKWEWYDDINTTRLFIHLLLTVNYEPQEWHGITIERGQRVSSFGKLVKETGLTIKQIRTALEHLKRTGEVAHTATPKYGLFTVINYDKYQIIGTPCGIEHGTNTGSQGAVKGQSKGNNGIKKNKANKEIKEKDIPYGISKKKYGEFENVMLDGQEHGKLVDSLGDKNAAEYIERLSAYLAQTGHRYKSHYATILNWWRKDGKPVSSKAIVKVLPLQDEPTSEEKTVDELFGPPPALIVAGGN